MSSKIVQILCGMFSRVSPDMEEDQQEHVLYALTEDGRIYWREQRGE